MAATSPAGASRPEESPAAAGQQEETKLYMREELESLITAKFKTFLKLPCGHCGASGACKRYAGSMPFVVKTMLDTFWCKECRRLLCEAHRSQHTCERLDAAKARLTSLTPDQLRARMEEEARRKIAAEEAAKAAERQVAILAEEKRQMMKGRRQLMATKTTYIANFLQTAARDDPAGRPARVKEELLELYTKANRINLKLWNEYESPSGPDVAEEEWRAVKDVYTRAVELLHTVVVVDGQELDLRNPWDEPQPQEQQ